MAFGRISIIPPLWTIALYACGYPAIPALPAGDSGVDAASDATRVDAGLSLPMASCRNLPATCGAGATDDCCRTLTVPSGIYYRSFDVAGDSQSGDQRFPATVSSFRLDKYEVTVGRFRAFLDAGQGTQTHPPKQDSGAHPNIALSGWQASWNASLALNRDTVAIALVCPANAPVQTWTESRADNEARPINCVTWYEAMAFCIWDWGYLPTEAEWNYAATSDEQRAYPWSAPPGSTAINNSYASYAVSSTDCGGDGLPGCAIADIGRVGSRPAGEGRWGHSDLGGNVSEWVLDWYANRYQVPCDNCAQVTSGSDRAYRGGSWGNFASSLRTGSHVGSMPTNRFAAIGFRCARPL
jgi:formylglycine-generating enzyme